MDHQSVLSMLNDIQRKMARQDEESLELKDQVTRLEEQNQQLRESSTVWQRECDRLRKELVTLPSRHNTVELDNLRAEVARLQDECRQLRASQRKNNSGCCCIQLYYVLFPKATTGQPVDPA